MEWTGLCLGASPTDRRGQESVDPSVHGAEDGVAHTVMCKIRSIHPL